MTRTASDRIEAGLVGGLVEIQRFGSLFISILVVYNRLMEGPFGTGHLARWEPPPVSLHSPLRARPRWRAGRLA